MVQIQGCRKPAPEFLYVEPNDLVEGITATSDEYCGDRFESPPLGPHSIFLCKDCAVRQGVIY